MKKHFEYYIYIFFKSNLDIMTIEDGQFEFKMEMLRFLNINNFSKNLSLYFTRNINYFASFKPKTKPENCGK